jgi:hypothetical protein
MKQRVTGKLVVVFLLLAVPLFIDSLLIFVTPSFGRYSMTGFMVKGYFGMLPLFIFYMLVASLVIYIWNKKSKKK